MLDVLKLWEKGLRDARFDVDFPSRYVEAREVLAGVVKDPKTDISNQVGRGREAIAQKGLGSFFSDLCSGHKWWAIDAKQLDHKDQCPTCQVWFAEVKLLIDNDPAHEKPLGAIWEAGRPWQCAEADVHIQLHRQNARRPTSPDSGPPHGAGPLPKASPSPAANAQPGT